MATPMSKPVIRAVSLTKIVQSGDAPLTILDDVSFDVESGATIAIVGASGSGKTTLLGLLAGLDKPTSGDVIVDGVALSTLDQDGCAAMRQRVLGFVFQSFQLLPALTALENVMLPLELAGEAEAASRARTWLARVGLARRTTHYPRQLSGGEQQRVAIARALVNDPAILVADEPTGNLDERATRGVFQLLRDINAGGTVVVMATHDLDLVRQTVYRTIEMRDGSLVYDSDVDEAAAEAQ